MVTVIAFTDVTRCQIPPVFIRALLKPRSGLVPRGMDSNPQRYLHQIMYYKQHGHYIIIISYMHKHDHYDFSKPTLARVKIQTPPSYDKANNEDDKTKKKGTSRNAHSSNKFLTICSDMSK